MTPSRELVKFSITFQKLTVRNTPRKNVLAECSYYILYNFYHLRSMVHSRQFKEFGRRENVMPSSPISSFGIAFFLLLKPVGYEEKERIKDRTQNVEMTVRNCKQAGENTGNQSSVHIITFAGPTGRRSLGPAAKNILRSLS